MLDTLIYVMIVLVDTTHIENRFEKEFNEADRMFRIEMLRQASHEAAKSAKEKTTYHTKLIKLYRKED